MTDTVFDKTAGLILDIRMWSGAKKLKEEDFAGIELPPEELVSLGSKRIHNKEALKPLQAVRTKAVTTLESVAVSLYGGKVWLLPENKTDEVHASLQALATEFENEKAVFLNNFYAQQQAWLEHNSKWASLLETHMETPESVEKKFGFTWRTFRISPAQNDNLAATVTDDVTSCLLKEVAILASEAHVTLKDRDRATPKNLNRLDKLVSKLRGMAFVDPGVGVIERELRQILEQRDTNGILTGQSVSQLARLLVQLKNPQVLTEVLEAARSGRQYEFTYAPQGGDGVTTPAPSPQKPKTTLQPRLPDAWF